MEITTHMPHENKQEASLDPLPPAPPDLYDPRYYINRELSLLQFHARVLREAQNPQVPLLERIKFLSIVSSNLDEFFMTRVAGLTEQQRAGIVELPPDAMTPQDQLAALREVAHDLMQRQRHLYYEEILPQLEANGVRFVKPNNLPKRQQTILNQYFLREIFPVLTPLGVDPGRPFPFISNLSLNMAVLLNDPHGQERFARIKIPTTVIPRLLSLKKILDRAKLESKGTEHHFIFVEDLIAANLDDLFPGMKIKASYLFRITRNADIEIAEEEADDLLETIESGLQQRRFGDITRLAVETTMPETVKKLLLEHMELSATALYEVPAPLGMRDLMALYGMVDLPALKDPPFVPRRPRKLAMGDDIFAAIRQHDILMHHPYDSFLPTVEFFQTAAQDPQVLAIKCTLYRLGSKSPIVEALLEARANDKQVSALVELKARFDEENNILWARKLEAAGVHVIYGFKGLKTHSKIVLVVRAEQDGVRRYVHLSTGNYNPTTARLYTDLALLSCREDLADDATQLFNRLTGFAPAAQYKKLLVAPEYLRTALIALIDREIEHACAGRFAHLIFKVNALVDPRLIRKLYEASMAGVQIDLIVRGICCLRPGLPPVSENIRVRSIVGRFLEHARIYYFANGGREEIYLGSADMMGRNLDRRVETVFPIEAPTLKSEIYDVILTKQLQDNVKAHLLDSEGNYTRLTPQGDEVALDSQAWFIEQSRGNV